MTTNKTTTDAILKCEPLHNTPTGGAIFEGIGGNFRHSAQIFCELIDDAASNLIAYPKENPEITLRLEDHGDYVDVFVTDNGTGIEDLNTAFTIAGRGSDAGPFYPWVWNEARPVQLQH